MSFLIMLISRKRCLVNLRKGISYIESFPTRKTPYFEFILRSNVEIPTLRNNFRKENFRIFLAENVSTEMHQIAKNCGKNQVKLTKITQNNAKLEQLESSQ